MEGKKYFKSKELERILLDQGYENNINIINRFCDRLYPYYKLSAKYGSDISEDAITLLTYNYITWNSYIADLYKKAILNLEYNKAIKLVPLIKNLNSNAKLNFIISGFRQNTKKN